MPVFRVIFVVLAGLSTSGCLFSAYQIASLTASGISYVISGRSVGDHAISMALKQDCATHRILEGEEICVDFPQDDTDTVMTVAKAPSLPENGNARDSQTGIGVMDAGVTVPSIQLAESVAQGFAGAEQASGVTFGFTPSNPTEPRPGEAALPADTASFGIPVAANLDPDSLLPAAGPEAIEKTPTSVASKGRPSTYLVIGSFQNSENAQRMGQQYPDLDTAIMTAESDGRKIYRVIAGPIGDGNLDDARAHFLKAGIRNTWAMRLCPDNLSLPPCRSTMLQQAQLSGR